MMHDEDEPIPDGSDMQRFVEEAPLYVWVPLSYHAQREYAQPGRVEIFCETCRCSRPYLRRQEDRIQKILRAADPPRRPPLIENGEVVEFAYICPGCMNPLDVWVEFNNKPEQRVRKVGQRPPRSIEIPNDVAKALGPEDSELLKKAKISMGQGFGIGACAYLRRVLEHQVNPILGLVLDARQNEGAPEEELAEIRSIIDGKAGDDKMGLVYSHAPRALVVGGINPLKLFYEFLSEGIHALPEPEAAKQAVRIHAALEFTVRELARAREDREAFAKTMRGLSSRT